MADKQNIDPNSKNNINLNRYETDVTGVSMKTLEAGLWWVKNRGKLRLVLIVVLIITSLISWGYTLFGFGAYLFSGMLADSQMVKNLAQNNSVGQNYLAERKAKDLTYSSPGFLYSEKKYDFYVLVSNPNPKHWGAFSYCFSSGAEKSCGKDFILPGERKYVLSLAQEFSANPSNLAFKIQEETWYRIDNHQIADWKKYRADRLNIAVKNPVFVPALESEISEKVPLNALSFSVANNSAYSYWAAPLTIILSEAGRISAVNRYVVNDFFSYDSEEIKITWPGAVGAVNNISITPDINIMDPSVYQQPNE